eukprot:10590694-Alexandrium_andersonii.AAC.1
MSASLVGSEMCIRDRASELTPEVLEGAFCLAFRADAESADEAGRPAVSYTRLTLPTICSV